MVCQILASKARHRKLASKYPEQLRTRQFSFYKNCLLKEGKNGIVDFQSPNFVQPTAASKYMHSITISRPESNWVS